MSNRLLEIYQGTFRTFGNIKLLGKTKATNPLLLTFPKGYELNLRVMFFGQETNDWHGEFKNEIYLELEMKKYTDFWYKKKSSYSKKGPFMQLLNKLTKEFNYERESAIWTDKVSCVWNNVLKIGMADKSGTPSKDIINWQDTWFKVIEKEVKLYNPDLVIFFTGPDKYDKYIKKSLGTFQTEEIEGFKKRAFSKLKFENTELLAYKTYHPNYLRRSGLESSVVEKLNQIMDDIKTHKKNKV